MKYWGEEYNGKIICNKQLHCNKWQLYYLSETFLASFMVLEYFSSSLKNGLPVLQNRPSEVLVLMYTS